MSDVSNELKIIENGIYGEDIRGALHSSISKLSEDFDSMVSKGYPVTTVESAVDNWGKNNAAAFIGDGTLTRSKFKKGEFVSSKPNFQQLCSVPVKHITGDSEKSSPTSFQSLMFASSSTEAEENTVIMLRTSNDESSTEAVVLDLTNPKSIKRYSLSGSHAGHANSAVLVNGVIYVATGHNVGDKGIAAFSYPGFVYLGRCGWKNYRIWSIAHDDARHCFYLAGWSTEDGNTNYKVYTINGDSLPYSVNAADMDNTTLSSYKLTKMFDYPEFFTSYATNVGAMSYCNDTFYISKHEPHNIVRMN